MTERTVSRDGWSLILRELRLRRRAVAFLAGWSVVESLPALLSGVLVAAALDRGFIAHRPVTGLGLLGLLGLSMVIRSAACRNTFPWLADIVEPLRDALIRTVVEGALTRAMSGSRSADGAAVSRLSGQAEMVRNLVSALLRMLRPTVAALFLVLVGLFALAPVVAAITAPLVLISLLLFGWSLRMLAARQRAMVLAEEAMAAISTDIFGGLRDVVACGAVDVAGQTAGRAIAAEARAIRIVARASSSRGLILAVGCHVPVILVLALAPWLLRTDRLTAGELVGAVTYLVGALDPALRTLAGTAGSWGRQLSVLLHRISETSSLPTGAVRPGQARPESADVHAVGLTFAYGPHAVPVIDNLDLHIAEGEHLAVIGPSGIGKSTLALLIAGLVQPQAGTVFIGGVPVSRIAEASLRHTVALIPQEAYVFTGTVRENLSYLNPQATTAEIDKAVRALGMGSLVDRLGGYDAMLGVGGPVLSAGERQLVALARVYLSPAQVLVLDEATCHLDPTTEARVEVAIAGTERTLVVIAHRISSARRAQRILVLDGASATVGTHEQLLATSPLYAELVGHWEFRQSVRAASPIGVHGGQQR